MLPLAALSLLQLTGGSQATLTQLGTSYCKNANCPKSCAATAAQNGLSTGAGACSATVTQKAGSDGVITQCFVTATSGAAAAPRPVAAIATILLVALALLQQQQ